MKLLFGGKILCSDETKCSRDLSFRDFHIDTKIIFRNKSEINRMYFLFGKVSTK